MKIDKNKTYKTVCGYEVKIYDDNVQGAAGGEVHGAVLTSGWQIAYWTSEYGFSNIKGYDLVEVRPRIKRDVFLNVYDNNVILHMDRTKAHRMAGIDRLACIVYTIDCEEGEGL